MGDSSFFFTPIYLLLNILNYANCHSLKPSPSQGENGSAQAMVAVGVAGVCLLGLATLIDVIFFHPK